MIQFNSVKMSIQSMREIRQDNLLSHVPKICMRGLKSQRKCTHANCRCIDRLWDSMANTYIIPWLRMTMVVWPSVIIVLSLEKFIYLGIPRVYFIHDCWIMEWRIWDSFVFVMPDGTDSNIVTVRVRANTQLRNLSSRMRNMSRPKQNH